MGKKINELIPKTTEDAANDNQLLPLCDPATGVTGRITIAQAKAAFATRKLKYIATGSEGVTLTIEALEGKDILLLIREGALFYEVDESPDSVEFTWNNTDIVFANELAEGERILIHYKTY